MHACNLEKRPTPLIVTSQNVVISEPLKAALNQDCNPSRIKPGSVAQTCVRSYNASIFSSFARRSPLKRDRVRNEGGDSRVSPEVSRW